MKFDRLKTKKRVVVEKEETDKEFASRIFKTMADEMRGELFKCTTFTKDCTCHKCPLHLPSDIIGVPKAGNTPCPLIAMKYLSEFIASKC